MRRLTAFLLLCCVTATPAADDPFPVVLQSRNPVGKTLHVSEKWLPSKTAIIVCDMWDLHHCKNAVIREGEMAPRMNQVLERARGQGVFIVHAPSSCMKFYEGTAARERAKSAPPAVHQPEKIAEWCRKIPEEEAAVYPIDQTNGGEDDDPVQHAAWAKELEGRGLNPRAPWTRQIDVLRIDQQKDAVSDSGVEVWNMLEARGIDNVILMGVHVNMCVAGRPFGLRQMASNGKHVVLMRDLTDSMYDPHCWPFVSHVRGTELFIEHVEKRICPTITSDQIIGGQPFAFSNATAGKKRLRILLLGDSTTEASIPKRTCPEEPQLEDMVRILLATEGDLPHTDVINLGLSGEYIRRLIDSGRYDKQVATQPDADYVFIRYGINDQAKREGFDANFASDYRELLARLRKDHPTAMLVPMTIIPYGDDSKNAQVNALIQQVAEGEKLTLFDIYPRYAAELKKGPHMLNYRRFPLSAVPDKLKPLAFPFVYPENDPRVVVMDNRLDAHFGHLPGWYGDRHPNLAGYHVIASETAKWLAPVIRESLGKRRSE
jgi:lysophospholipase L1-like esterase/nicotinamidase-related amidase